MQNNNLFRRALVDDPTASDFGAKRMIIGVLCISLVMDALLIIAGINAWVMAFFGVLLILALVLALFNILLPARLLLPIAGLVMFGFLMIQNKGLRDTAILGLPLVLIAASLLIGKWGAIVYGTLSITMIAGFGWAENSGYIHNDFTSYNNPTDYIAVGVTLALIAVFQWLVIDRLNENIKRARRSEEAQKMANEALRESEEEFRSFVEQSSEGILLTDEEGRIIQWNKAYERMTGMKSEEVAGKYLWDAQYKLIPPARVTDTRYRRIRDMTVYFLQTGKSDHFNRPVEALIQSADGAVRHIMQTAFPIKTKNGFRVGSVMQDITVRKQADLERERLIREMESKNAELERFTYTVSHDLKSPLITIRGFLDLIERDVREEDFKQLNSDIDRIRNAADKMQRLLNELLELSRVGRLLNPPQEIPFNEIVKDALDLVHGQITARGVDVRITPNLPSVYGDRARLVEVVQNLLDNAVKFMGEQSRPRIEIGVRGTEEGGDPIFFVSDNGIGIEPQYHEKVFGLFNKLDPRTEGTGVGLALVKRIIEVHGGRIWIESEGVGRGTTFCFIIKNRP
jgi:PAS domain S-box-containing protein